MDRRRMERFLQSNRGGFEMKEDEVKPEETLKYALEQLEDAKFAFASFVDAFKRYLKGGENGTN